MTSPGPRPRGPFSGKRRTLTTRITERTRLRLEAAAMASGRSLSQEIEIRLERSFWQDGPLPHVALPERILRAVERSRHCPTAPVFQSYSWRFTY